MKSDVTTLQELLSTNRAPGTRDIDPTRRRRAIITGGDSGIGRYTALALAEAGCDVAFTYAHHEDDAKLTAQGVQSFGREAYVHHLDLEQPASAGGVIDAMVANLGGLDIFVSNAGAMGMTAFPELELDQMHKLFDVNTFGAILATQRAAQHMLGMSGDGASTIDAIAEQARKAITGEIASPRETPGRIIVVTSVHEHIVSPADAVYTMTKHALGAFIKSAAYALKGTNVTVNGVRPGEIATPLNDMGPEDALKNDRPHIPTPRTGHPTEIASIIRYLASDETSFINGASYDVDGGMVVGGAMAQGMYRKMV